MVETDSQNDDNLAVKGKMYSRENVLREAELEVDRLSKLETSLIKTIASAKNLGPLRIALDPNQPSLETELSEVWRYVKKS